MELTPDEKDFFNNFIHNNPNSPRPVDLSKEPMITALELIPSATTIQKKETLELHPENKNKVIRNFFRPKKNFDVSPMK